MYLFDENKMMFIRFNKSDWQKKCLLQENYAQRNTYVNTKM